MALQAAGEWGGQRSPVNAAPDVTCPAGTVPPELQYSGMEWTRN